MDTTVLVIEDDLEINELIGEYLAIEKMKYLQALTGQAGIHQALNAHPDAIILDLMLPDIHGFEVARKLSSHRVTFDIPIIILTCMCQDCDREKGIEAGAFFFMTKPFAPDDLLAVVADALEWKAALPTRVPVGELKLGEPAFCNKSLNQMAADLFARTNLSDEAVGQIREAAITLNTWARQWNKEHAARSILKLDYAIEPLANGTDAPTIDWQLTEDVPGLLADAFFKPQANPGVMGSGLMGWGASALLNKPAAQVSPPAQWLQILGKTGAARFEKNSRTHEVHFRRSGSTATPPVNGAGVPVVEMDANRPANGVRDEILTARRK